MDEVTFRPLTAADLPMLHAWLARPHVAEWWDGVPTLAEVEADWLPMLGPSVPSGVRPCIAMLGTTPIGYIQAYIAAGSGDGWWEDVTDPGVRGIDQFLCDVDSLGMGLGTRMVRAFTDMLLADPAVTYVQTDPDPRNGRAIRCYEKAGFRRVRELDTPDGRALLMIRER